jgi:hypothetical protein
MSYIRANEEVRGDLVKFYASDDREREIDIIENVLRESE